MSSTLFDLEAILTLNIASYVAGLASAESLTKESGTKMTSVFSKLAGAIAALQIGKKLIGFGKDTINAASDFESAFTGVKKTVDATVEEYETLADWIMEASTKMAASKESIAGTMEIAGQLGIRGVEGLEKFTETMVMLGDTTNLTAEEAAGALARFSNITGISAEEADKIGSVIVDLGNNFATTEQDIVAMATRLAGAGTQFGLSGSEILGFATALSSVGIQAEMGGSAFSKAMIKMQVAAETGYDRVNDLEKKTGHTLRELELMASNDSAGFKVLAQRLGMTTKEVNEIIKSGNELNDFAKVAGMTRDEFVTAFRDDSTAALQAFIQGLGNTDAAGESTIQMLQEMGFTEVRLRDTLTRLAGSNDLITKSVDMANKAFEDNVALTKEATLRYGTTESQAMQTAESFKNLKVIIGQELLPVYGQVMSFSQEAMKAMTEGLQTGGLSGFMSSVGTAFSQALTAITESIPTVVSAGASLVSALGQGIIDNLPIFLQTGVQIVSQLSGYVIEAAPTLIPAAVQLISDFAMQLIEQIPTLIPLGFQLIQSVATGLMDAIPVLTENIPLIIDQILTTFTSLLPSMITMGIELLTSIVADLPTIIKNIVGAIPKIVDSIVEAITNPTTIKAIVEGAVIMVGEIARNFPYIMLAILKAIPTLIKSIIDAWFNIVAEFGKVFGEAFLMITKIFAPIGDWFKETFSKAKEKAHAAFEGIKDFMADTREKIKERFSAIGDWFSSTFNNAKEKAHNAFKGIKEKMSETRENINAIFDKIGGWFYDKFDDAKEKAQNAFKGIKDYLTQDWDESQDVFTNVGIFFFNRFFEAKEKVSEAWADIHERMSKVWDNIVSAFDLSSAFNWGRDMIQNFIDGINAMWNSLREKVSSVGSMIKDFIGFSEPKKGPLHDFHTFAPDMMDLFMQGITDNQKRLQDTVVKAFDFEDLISSPVVNGELNLQGGANNNRALGGNYYTINVNQPVSTPADMLREIRTEAQYGLMIGEALA